MATRFKHGFLILCALLVLGGEAWAQIRADQLENPPIPDGTFSELPASPAAKNRFVVSDCLDESCSAGGGSLVRELRYTGSEWVVLSGGTGSTTIDQGFDAGNGKITGANESKPFDVCGEPPNDDDCIRIYRSSAGVMTLAPVVGGVEGDADRIFSHNAGKKTQFLDSDGNVEVEYTEDVGFSKLTIASEAQGDILYRDGTKWTVLPAGTNGQVLQTQGAAANPQWATLSSGALGSAWFGAGSLSTDGTQCAAPAEVTINSGPKLWTIICTDNDGSTIYGSIGMPDSWDGGTVTFEHQYIQTAADTGVLNGDIAAQCRGAGEVPSSTWGTEVAIDDAAVTGSNAIDHTTSGAVTPAGTCAGGDTLFFRYQLDAGGTTTAVATLHHVGFKLEYSKSGNSD